MRITTPEKPANTNLVQSLQVQDSIESDKNQNPLLSLGEISKVEHYLSEENKEADSPMKEEGDEIEIEQLSFMSAYMPRSPPRPMFFYKSGDTGDANNSFEQMRDSLNNA